MRPVGQAREELLKAAKEEFLEKGYMKASLRSICKKAEVTTGALYFFFQDKEDLFGSLVEEPLNKLLEVMKTHYAEELEELAKGFSVDTSHEDHSNDIEASIAIVNNLFDYYDEVVLLLTKSQGSKYEHCLDQFVNLSEQHYRKFADAYCDACQIPKLEKGIIHWVSHLQTDAYVQIITHHLTKEQAIEQTKVAVKFMIAGWFGMFQP